MPNVISISGRIIKVATSQIYKTGQILRLYETLSGLCGMRVDRSEVELASDQEQYGAHGGEVGIAARTSPGGLKPAVESFHEAVGLARRCPGNDAIEVLADHASHLLRGFNCRAHHGGAPLLEHRGDDVDLFAIEDVAQLLAIQSGAGGTLCGEVGALRHGPTGRGP
jgi:hypothetical protein